MRSVSGVALIVGCALWAGLCVDSAFGTPVVASYYHEPQGIACGKGRYDPEGMTAAHKTLPCGSRVRVTYKGKSVDLTINDRGPYVGGRALDLSLAAARSLGMIKAGVVPVDMEVLK